MAVEAQPRARSFLALAAAVLIAAGAGWQLTRSSGSEIGNPGSDAAVGLTLFSEGERPQLPDVTGQTLEQKPLSLLDAKGHILVVNVWGSWCGPCRAEAPDLAAVAKENSSTGVWFVGIDTRDNPDAGLAFTRRYGIPYPSLDDQKGQVLAQFTGIIPISAVPSTLVVDESGAIAARVVGRIDATTLRGIIADLVSSPEAEQPA